MKYQIITVNGNKVFKSHDPWVLAQNFARNEGLCTDFKVDKYGNVRQTS